MKNNSVPLLAALPSAAVAAFLFAVYAFGGGDFILLAACVSAAGAVLTAVMSAASSRRLKAAVKKVSEFAAAGAGGVYNKRIPVTDKGAFGEMETNLNVMMGNMEKMYAKMGGAVERERAAAAAKGEFLARMSHEMRTPLNAVIGMAQIAQKGGRDNALYCVEKIENASRHLLGLVNDVLDMSDIESGRFVPAEGEVRVAEMIRSVRDVTEFRASEKNQRLVVDIAAGVPRMITADGGRLSQVLSNLMTNAVKFTPHGGVITLTLKAAAENRLRFEVKDTGIGVSDEQKSRIFTLFEQASVSTAREYGGTGLGLAICKSLVELMGGSIWVESEQGKGSTFIFEVNAKFLSRPEEPEDAVEDFTLAFRGRTALLAEDIEINREVAMGLLAETGLEFVCVENGAEAVEYMSKPNNIDIILMDMQMPLMDGVEAAKKIRGLGVGTPIVAMSANVFKDDVEACRAAGMDAHIGKPFDAGTAVRVIRKFLT